MTPGAPGWSNWGNSWLRHRAVLGNGSNDGSPAGTSRTVFIAEKPKRPQRHVHALDRFVTNIAYTCDFSRLKAAISRHDFLSPRQNFWPITESRLSASFCEANRAAVPYSYYRYCKTTIYSSGCSSTFSGPTEREMFFGATSSRSKTLLLIEPKLSIHC